MMVSRTAQAEQPLDLPPGYTLVSLREYGDAFAHGCTIAAEAGAGTLVWVRRYDLVEFAVVLEPDEPLTSARRAFFAGMNAIGDAIAVHCPPEREVQFTWPDTILFDGGVLGGGRLGWPKTCREDEVPDWLVFGVILRAADMAHVEETVAAGGSAGRKTAARTRPRHGWCSVSSCAPLTWRMLERSRRQAGLHS